MYGQRQDRQKERGNLVFFTERKTEKLDIVCHRDTKMLLINNCNRMKQQRITNGEKKWMDTQEEGLFCLHSGSNDPLLRLQWWVWRLPAATIEASHSSKEPQSSTRAAGNILTFHVLIFYGGVGTLDGLLANSDKLQVTWLQHMEKYCLYFSIFWLVKHSSFSHESSLHCILMTTRTQGGEHSWIVT